MSSSQPFPPGLPYVAPSTTATALVDGQQLRPDVQTARVNGTEIRFTPSPAVVWLVPRITVQSTASPTTARVYVIPAGMAVSEDYFVAGTFTGEADEDDTNQPIVVPEGHQLVIVWSVAGAPARARIEYRELSA